ncbi:MAG: sugar-binding protein [Bacteroidota bacterium]
MKKLVAVLILLTLSVAVAGSALAYVRKEINIYPAPAGLKIDGKLDEWHTSAIVSQDPKKGRESAVLYFMYDKDNLYIAGEIKDATPLLNDKVKVAEVYQGDAIEIFISADPKADPERESYAPTDRQFALVMGKQPHSWMWATNGDLPGTEIAAVVTDFGENNPGYIFEAKVPLKSIHPDLKLAPGMKIGFDCAVDFSTEDGTNREIQHSWNAGSNSGIWAVPKLWGYANIK